MTNTSSDSLEDNIILMSAGSGSRMKTKLPKILHKIAGMSIIDILRSNLPIDCNTILVVSPELMSGHASELKDFSNIVVQEKAIGTGNAVKVAIPHLSNGNKTLILYGDTPNIQKDTIRRMLDSLDDKDFVVSSFRTQELNNYGKIVGDSAPLVGDIARIYEIIEHREIGSRDVSDLCVGGMIAIKTDLLKSIINDITNNNSAGEYYLTDLVAIAQKRNVNVYCYVLSEFELSGFNSYEELSKIRKYMLLSISNMHMSNGVNILDQQTTFIDFGTKVGQNTTIGSNVRIGHNVIIGDDVIIDGDASFENCKIGNGTHIERNVQIYDNSVIGKSNQILGFTYLRNVVSGNGCILGPFLFARFGTIIADQVELGSFVSTKNVVIKEKSKAKHLSYLGDANIGKNVNIGAGVVTCNYDGISKNTTNIKDDAFIGSNTSLIAPIDIGDGALIAAGSIVRKVIPDNALGFNSCKQVIAKDKGAHSRRARSKKV